MDDQLTKKESSLKSLLGKSDGIAVAFSGGVDSTLLLDVTHEVQGLRTLALTSHFACSPGRDQQSAHRFCKERGIRHVELAFDEFSVAGFAENPANRCYLCKKALFSQLLALAAEEGFSELIEGSNLDDESDYRPGLVALGELPVASPLRTLGFTKDDIRLLAQKRGLAAWDKPSGACLATRVPYGTRITPELVLRIDKSEEFILTLGVKQVRVRVMDTCARIEVDKKSMFLLEDEAVMLRLRAHFNSLGFEQIELDPQGYRTGSLNVF